jgi:hypothetical protein
MQFSQFPWRRGIGNGYQKVFDHQGSTVAIGVGVNDGVLIAAAPDMLEYIRSSASAGCATAQALLEKQRLMQTSC